MKREARLAWRDIAGFNHMIFDNGNQVKFKMGVNGLIMIYDLKLQTYKHVGPDEFVDYLYEQSMEDKD